MAKKRKKRRMITKRFYVTLSVVLALVVLAVFLIFGGDKYGTIVEGTMSMEQQTGVVIVRDEAVFSVSNYAMASFSVTEGELITQGTTVGQVYKWGFNAKLLTDLITVQEQIRDAQENDIWAEVVDKTLNDTNAKINNKIQEIAAVVQGNAAGDIVQLERKLKELFDQKKDFLKRNVQADARLTALYDQETAAQAALGNWREEVIAQANGVVSFYLDGLETQLTPYNLDLITKTDIDNARKGVSKAVGTDNATTKQLYRLVNNYKWYCCIYVDANDAIDEMREGAEARLTFEGYYDRPYTAKIISVRIPQGGGKLYVLEMSEDVSPLLSVRTANAKLLLSFTGLKVESNAIHSVDKQTMLKVEQGDKLVYVPVDVLIDDGDFCIVKNLSADVQIDVNTKILLR